MSQRFKERFKGRISHVNKEGDYGVVANARLPIQKLQQMQDHSHMSNFSYLEPIGRHSAASQPKTRDAETEIADFPLNNLGHQNHHNNPHQIIAFKTIDATKVSQPNGASQQLDSQSAMAESRSQHRFSTLDTFENERTIAPTTVKNPRV